MKNNTILKFLTYICRVEFLLYFCMKKREKLGDYILDISKYVLTAVLITLFFNDISSSRFVTYFVGGLVAVSTLYWSLFYFNRK